MCVHEGSYTKCMSIEFLSWAWHQFFWRHEKTLGMETQCARGTVLREIWLIKCEE